MKKQEFIDAWFNCGVLTEKYRKCMDEDIDSVIQQAIADHEQAKWKKYPENKPDRMTLYLCQCESDGKKWTEVLTNPKAINYWIFAGYQIIGDDLGVIAFRELPAPYEPKTE